MIELYRNLWVEKMPAYQALHQAQRTMRSGWDPVKKQLVRPGKDQTPVKRESALSPWYWGGFVVSGSWK